MSFKHIIIADDHRTTRHSLKNYLTAILSGVDIRQARNGYEVLDLVAIECPDLILMDVEMPHLDGLQATRQIKANWPQVKIIVLITREEETLSVLDAGAETCLFKGSPPEMLRDAVLAALPDVDQIDAGKDLAEDDDEAEHLGTTPGNSG
jgi:DNA-binding NarL/FixJ family response regulator